MPPPTPPNIAEEYTCRPCRKTYSRKELDGRRSCPKCRGPLFNENQVAGYRAKTATSLKRHQTHAAVTSLSVSALVAAVESTAFLQQAVSEARTFAAVSITACAIASALVITWWRIGSKALMPLGLSISQATTMLSWYLVSATIAPAYISMGLLPLAMVMQLLLMAGFFATIYAWQQFVAYSKVKAQKGL